MITAVDTSVLLDVFKAEPPFVARSQDALRQAIREGALVACDVVWAELRPWFADDHRLLAAMETLGVTYSPCPIEAAVAAGRAWQAYRQAGGRRDHLVADFLVAGHATAVADRLLTRDRGFYRRWFERLRLLEP